MASSLKSSLSPARRQLLLRLQTINFGRIEDLRLQNGEPLLETATTVREIKFGGDNAPRPEADLTDFQLKAQIIELFSHFDRIRDGVVRLLEVKHGLPFKMNVEDAA